MLRSHFLLAAILIAYHSRAVLGITVTSSAASGGPNAAALVATIVDSNSHYTVVSGSQNTTINATGDPTSNARAMGTFSNGVTATGTLLPAANQNSAGDAAYAGGIDINSGICLCTGMITDNDPLAPAVPSGFGVGVEGPNNGQPLTTGDVQPGEISFQLAKPSDNDFTNVVAIGGDATVLNFKITLSMPGYLRISFVHASDEFPRFALSTYNDTTLVFVGDANGQNLKNFIVFRDGSNEMALSLTELRDCKLLKGNLVAPNPPILPVSGHANVGTTLHFNHEFAGFTKKLTREKCDVFPPGTYTIKIVVQDVYDDVIDSATFFEAASLKLYHFDFADFDLDGDVDGGDYSILYTNWQQCGKKFIEGDANGDGCVNEDDYDILVAGYFNTGSNRDLKFDFNRDNFVDGTDYLIWQQNVTPLDVHCRSRFEGDADGDGDVQTDDMPPGGSTAPAVVGCGEHGGHMRSGGGDELTHGESAVYHEAADVDHDGDVDFDDVKLFGQQMAPE